MKLTIRQIAISAALAALSATVQIIHIGYVSPTWGMWIDVVSVTWVIAYFLFGFQSSLLVSLVGSLIITLFAPETWLGASMKFVATIPIILSLFGWVVLRKQRFDWYAKPSRLIFPVLIGTVIRSLLVLPLNYYYAIPIWTGMAPVAAMKAIPWFIIIAFNIIQTIVDVTFAWIIVYKFKLSRFSEGKTE
jgi:riboflavin transporter FmnP